MRRLCIGLLAFSLSVCGVSAAQMRGLGIARGMSQSGAWSDRFTLPEPPPRRLARNKDSAGFGFPHHPHFFRRHYWGGYWGPVYYGGYIPFDYDILPDTPATLRDISILSLPVSFWRISLSLGLCSAGELSSTRASAPPRRRYPPPPEQSAPAAQTQGGRAPTTARGVTTANGPENRFPRRPCWCFATATSGRWIITPSWDRPCSCFPAGRRASPSPNWMSRRPCGQNQSRGLEFRLPDRAR